MRAARPGKGRLASWNDEKGFGFISPATGGGKVFVHIKAFRNRRRRPEIGQSLSYVLSADRRGRPCAADVSLAGERKAKRTTQQKRALPAIVAVLFLVGAGVGVVAAGIPLVVLGFYVAASLVTFIVYARDKSAARKGARRTPENTLHMLALAGGWPGALLAQQRLRHKSRKQPFRTLFWVTVGLNCGAFAWLLSASGVAVLQALPAGFS